jgi:hypothetical protein
VKNRIWDWWARKENQRRRRYLEIRLFELKGEIREDE